MAARKTVLGICGSTRTASSNLQLLKAIANLAAQDFGLLIYLEIAALPHFNPDYDGALTPAPVQDFRQRIRAADGVLICTPEYAMSIPGSMKNALDWCVRDATFSGKPTGLITASSQGMKAHAAMTEVLSVIEARMLPETQLLISFVKTKVNEAGISDAETMEQVRKLLQAFTLLL